VTNKDSIIHFPAITGLPTVNPDDYDLGAVVSLVEFQNAVIDEVKIYRLSEQDLTDEELAQRQKHVDDLMEWLNNCKKGMTWPFINLHVISPARSEAMTGIRNVLKGAYARKREKVEKLAEMITGNIAEQLKRTAAKERDRRIKAALDILNVEALEPERFLSELEFNMFKNSIGPAVEAVIKAQDQGDTQPDAWMFSSKAYSFILWREKISDRKREWLREREDAARAEEASKRAADNAAARIFQFTKAVNEFRVSLLHQKKPVIPYPAILTAHKPEVWFATECPEDEQIEELAAEEIRTQIPEELAGSIKYSMHWDVRVMPHASYELQNDIPCLLWESTAFILVTVELELGKCRLYEKQNGQTILVEGAGQKLGTLYIRLERECVGNELVPITLLKIFSEGKMEGPGVTLVDYGNGVGTYKTGNKLEVVADDKFKSFISHLSTLKSPLWVSLESIGIIDKQVAMILEQKWQQLAISSVDLKPASVVGKDIVVEKLTEIGWSKEDAIKMVDSLVIPPEASIEDIVKKVVEKSEDDR